MKPDKIMDILDIARRARQIDEVFNPLFVGPPGVGKSHIVQAWCKKNSLPFIDLRSAYLEAPDVIGFPSIINLNGRQTTTHNTPEFWPIDPNWEGVLLLEEPNRGTTSILNCWMQLLTDRKIHKYELPKGCMIVGCINPESNEYDVNTMDAALKNRFEIFEVTYDKQSFVKYMNEAQWQHSIISFVESGIWNFVNPEAIKNVPGSKYVSPRTMSKLNAALKAGFLPEDESLIYKTILGDNVGKDFYSFTHNENPVMYQDLISDFDKAFIRLQKFSDTSNLQSGMISVTIKSILTDAQITDDLLVKVVKIIPVDQSIVLIRELESKREDKELLRRICKEYPEIKDQFSSVLNYGKQKP